MTAQYSRESLKHAEYIAQIDDKYLLVKLPLEQQEEEEGTGKGSDLVMFDQHAVSERIRVEKYLERILCSRNERVEKWVLDQALGVVTGREEAELIIKKWNGEFEKWGFEISSGDDDTQSRKRGNKEQDDYRQIWVRSVPKLIGERLIKDPKLLQEVIRSYLVQLEENQPRTLSSTEDVGNDDDEEEASWVGRLKELPIGLLELINSKSCRGAIMFNDRKPPSSSIYSAFLSKISTDECLGVCRFERRSRSRIVVATGANQISIHVCSC